MSDTGLDTQSAAQSGAKAIRGVFSTQEIRRVGTGTTTRKTVAKTFWFVDQGPDGRLECQPLNTHYVPSGPKRTLTMDELMSKFAPEPEFYMNSVYPKMQSLQQTISGADAMRDKGETFSAEYEYQNALKIDEDNVRANFGIGLTYLQRGENNKAEDIFQRLVTLDAAFEPKHKHLFNDFGINLRKSKMFPQSVAYYKRALELSPQDENLYMNLARAQLEIKDIAGCVENLLKALDINPQHETSLKFLDWLSKKNMIPGNFVPAVQIRLTPAASTDSAS